MTDQQPSSADLFKQYMDHVISHECDLNFCKIAKDLAWKVLLEMQIMPRIRKRHTSEKANE